MNVKPEAVAEVLAEMRSQKLLSTHDWADRIERALSAQGEAVASNEVLIAITRGEGYEDVHPQLVAEDALRQTLHGGCQFAWRVVTPPAPALVTEEAVERGWKAFVMSFGDLATPEDYLNHCTVNEMAELKKAIRAALEADHG